MYPRRFARVRPTGRISDAGKLIVGPKAPVIDCRVIDYSPGGACLELSGQTKVPNRFELLHGGTKKRCRVVGNDIFKNQIFEKAFYAGKNPCLRPPRQTFFIYPFNKLTEDF